MSIKKIILALIGGSLIGIGAGTILYANIGGDAITVFQDGIHVLLKISYGQASRIYNVVFVLLALVLARKYSGAGTVVSALMIGFLIDIIYSLWSSIVVDAGFVVSLLVFLIGLVIYALGIAVLIRCDAGMNCLDALLYRLMDVTNFKYRYLRIAADIILTLSGCLMGGVFGLGTVLSVLLTGPLTGFFAGVKK